MPGRTRLRKLHVPWHDQRRCVVHWSILRKKPPSGSPPLRSAYAAQVMIGVQAQTCRLSPRCHSERIAHLCLVPGTQHLSSARRRTDIHTGFTVYLGKKTARFHHTDWPVNRVTRQALNTLSTDYSAQPTSSHSQQHRNSSTRSGSGPQSHRRPCRSSPARKSSVRPP